MTDKKKAQIIKQAKQILAEIQKAKNKGAW